MGRSIPHPCLCLVPGRRALLGQIDEAVAGGVDMVQLRDKELPAGDLLDLAVTVKEVISGRALLIVNDRADVALAADADGVQLGELALPPAAARRIMGPYCLIGRSVHSRGGSGRRPSRRSRLSGCGGHVSHQYPPGSIPGRTWTVAKHQPSYGRKRRRNSTDRHRGNY